VAFSVFFGAHVLAALFSPIQDCDEVYNFWEPTHYLNHGYGMQTWEFSPEYAIRSWLYVTLHAIPIYVGSWLPFISNKTGEFYFLRVILAFLCASCETRLFAVISKAMNPRIAIFFLIATVSSTGMFHASTSYLPSSFAMYGTLLAFAAFMGTHAGLRTAQGLTWLAVGTILGWPFVAVLSLPFVFEELMVSSITGEWLETFWRLLDGFVRSLVILVGYIYVRKRLSNILIVLQAFEVCVDSFFYKKLTCVPLNIIWYNVFSGSSRGPEIYGTEPWHFYFRNLVINFSVWFILAILAFPLLIYQKRYLGLASSRLPFHRAVIFISPLYLWLAIFTIQPHKEERFMYPVYPSLALNAALSLHIIIVKLSSSNPRSIVGKLPPSVKLVSTSIFVLLAITAGLLRTIGLATAYSAPLKVFNSLQQPGLTDPRTTVCLGKEWYRFPSSYHLPNGAHAKFVKSEFNGLLPGEFSEARTGFGLFPGAWLVPRGMNDENKEDLGKYTDVEHCTYLVDSHFPGAEPSALEPAYMLDAQRWEKVSCEPFLDTARTGILGRLLWLPDSALVPERYRRKWGEYCLLRRKR